MPPSASEPLIPPRRALPEGSPDRVLRDVARWSVGAVGAVEPLSDPSTAGELVDLAMGHGLLGPLVSTLIAGAVAFDPSEEERARARHEAAMIWCLRLEQRLLDVEERFEKVGGISHRVLKGPSVAHLDEPDPSLRSFADIDLLIEASDMDRSIRVLAEMGAIRRIPERRPGFDRRFVKGVGTTCADGIEIDVHRTLSAGPFGFRLPVARLFAEVETFEVGGRAVPALSARHRLLHACYHAVVGSATPPLRTLRDLAGHLQRPDLTPGAVASEARLWGGEAVLVTAVRECIGAFDLDAPAWSSWAEEQAVDVRDAQIMERGRVPGQHLVDWDAVRALPRAERPAFLFAVAFPSRELLAHRGETPGGRIVRGVRRALPRSDRGSSGGR